MKKLLFLISICILVLAGCGQEQEANKEENNARK